MPIRRKRARVRDGRIVSGGQETPPGTGILPWGPSFGQSEGDDQSTHDVQAAVDLDDVGLTGFPFVNVQYDLEKLELAYLLWTVNASVSFDALFDGLLGAQAAATLDNVEGSYSLFGANSAVDLDDVALNGFLDVLAGIDLTTVDLFNDMGVNANVDGNFESKFLGHLFAQSAVDLTDVGIGGNVTAAAAMDFESLDLDGALLTQSKVLFDALDIDYTGPFGARAALDLDAVDLDGLVNSQTVFDFESLDLDYSNVLVFNSSIGQLEFKTSPMSAHQDVFVPTGLTLGSCNDTTNHDGENLKVSSGVATNEDESFVQFDLDDEFGWNHISTATYNGEQFSVSGQETAPQGLFFKSDGTKCFIIGLISDEIHAYDLSTAWDISTAVFNGEQFSVSVQDNAPRGLFFKPDGMKCFIIGSVTDEIHAYDLSTAWDISTAAFNSEQFDVSGQEFNPSGLFFKPDGTKCFIIGVGSDEIHAYDLSTAWDISTAAFNSEQFDVSGQETNPQGLFFKPDGTKCFTIGETPRDIHAYDLSTAWDISTATFNSEQFSVFGQEISPQDLFFKPDGLKCFIIGGNLDEIHAYDIPASPSFPSNVTLTEAKLILTSVGSALQVDHELRVQLLPPTPWDVTGLSFGGEEFLMTGQSGSQGIYFKPDGLKLFSVSSSSDDIHAYDLSTAWDVSTATFNNEEFSVSSQDPIAQGVAFKSDGTKFFICGDSTNKIYAYDLSTAWDVSTATYNSESANLASGNTLPGDIKFKPDGTKCFIGNSSGTDIFAYDLSTPWDVSTAVHSGEKYVSAEGNTIGITFSPDGSKFFTLNKNDDTIYSYEMSTPWDISSATYTGDSFDISGQETSPTGLFFRPNGVKCFTTGSSGNIHAFELTNEESWDETTLVCPNEPLGEGTILEFTAGGGASDKQIILDLLNDDNGASLADGLQKKIGSAFRTSFRLFDETTGGSTREYYSNETADGVAWDVTTLNEFDVPLSVFAQETFVTGLFFKPDGTKCFTIGAGSEQIHAYELLFDWDLTGATHQLEEFSVSSQDTQPHGLFFKPDGTKCFIIGRSNDQIHAYDLSTAWEIDTATYNNEKFSVTGQGNNPRDIFFKSDGTKCFYVDAAGTIYAYDLSTAWDISTASFNGEEFDVTGQDLVPGGLSFKSDGTKCFIIGFSDEIHAYDLSTAWDISTAAYNGEQFDLSPDESNSTGLFFKPDGTKCFVCGTTGDDITTYGIREAPKLRLTFTTPT